MNPDKDELAGELGAWWFRQAEYEVEQVVDKAVEYGARDLEQMGRELAHMAGRDDLTPAQHAELGCVQYLVGKMARVSAAWSEGRMPSDDTYLDIGVYVRMVQRIRQDGGWPAGPTTTQEGVSEGPPWAVTGDIGTVCRYPGCPLRANHDGPHLGPHPGMVS